MNATAKTLVVDYVVTPLVGYYTIKGVFVVGRKIANRKAAKTA